VRQTNGSLHRMSSSVETDVPLVRTRELGHASARTQRRSRGSARRGPRARNSHLPLRGLTLGKATGCVAAATGAPMETNGSRRPLGIRWSCQRLASLRWRALALTGAVWKLPSKARAPVPARCTVAALGADTRASSPEVPVSGADTRAGYPQASRPRVAALARAPRKFPSRAPAPALASCRRLSPAPARHATDPGVARSRTRAHAASFPTRPQGFSCRSVKHPSCKARGQIQYSLRRGNPR